jgi:O-antigen/teichoic acid export membrane protein
VSEVLFSLRGVVSPLLHGGDGKSLSLSTNFRWALLGRIAHAGSQWAALAVLAKLTSPGAVGRYSLGLALTAPVIMLTNLHLRAVQVTDARRQYAFGHYLALRLVMTAVALLAIAGLALGGGYDRETAAVVLALGLVKAIDAVGEVYLGRAQQCERMDVSGRAALIKGVSSLALMSGTVALTGSAFWGALALAAGGAGVFLGYLRPRVAGVAEQTGLDEGLGPLWQWRDLSALARLALPLGVVTMLISLNANIPRFFVERLLGGAALGHFTAMAYVQIAGGVVVGALGEAASPRLAAYYAAGRLRAFTRLLARMLCLGLALGAAGLIGAAVLGRPVLTFLYRPDYARRLDVFACLMLAAGLSYLGSFLGYGMTAARRFRAQLPIFASAAAATTATCAFLVPRLGMQGAAWAVVVAALTQVVGSGYVVWRALRFSGRSGAGSRGPVAVSGSE